MPRERGDRPGRLHPKVWQVLGLCLLVLLTAYFIKGFYYLLFDSTGAGDFQARWRTMQYLYRGHYPDPGTYDSSAHFDPGIGTADYGGYFPWSFFSFGVLVPPLPLAASRVYFAIINLISLAVLGLFSYRSFEKYGRQESVFAVVSVLAISSHCTTLGIGQTGIVLNAALVTMFECLNSRRLVSAGLWYGFALLKPNVSALYLLVLLTPKRYKAAAVAAGYIVSTSLLVAFLTGTDVLALVIQPFGDVHKYASQGSFVIAYLEQVGLPVHWVVPFVAVACGGLCLLLLRRISLMPLIYQFAIASTVGRLCTYHRAYDNVMLVFLYIGFLHFVLVQPTRPHRAIFFLLALSLWLPTAWFDAQPMAIAQACVWIGATVTLIKGYISQPHHHLKPPFALPSKEITSPS